MIMTENKKKIKRKKERQRLCERAGLMKIRESKRKREGYIEMGAEREKK